MMLHYSQMKRKGLPQWTFLAWLVKVARSDEMQDQDEIWRAEKRNVCAATETRRRDCAVDLEGGSPKCCLTRESEAKRPNEKQKK
jgi:hypothetical protein